MPLAALETLLARGSYSTHSAIDTSGWLCQTFDVPRQQDWPIAPLSLLADGIDPGEHYWLRADPVHLRISRDQLILTDSRTFSLSSTEAEALLATLNKHFAQDGWQFFAPHPERWYLRLAQPPHMTTHALSEAAGGYVDAYMPEGEEGPRWPGVMNEIQMLLHQHPINEARELHGEPEINSVWLWGGGVLPPLPTSPFDRIYANLAQVQAFASLTHTPHAALPANAQAWLGERPAGDSILIVLNQLDLFASYGDTRGWQQSLLDLELHWFAPLLQALKNGKLDSLSLHALGNDQAWQVQVRRKDLWKFWRRKQALTELIQN